MNETQQRRKYEKETIALSEALGLSGYEAGTAREAARLLKPYMDTVEVDRFGNLIGRRSCGRQGAPVLLLDAHLDQVGLMVSRVTEEGYLLFEKSGGVDPRVLPGGRVTVAGFDGKEYRGVIGCRKDAWNEEKDAASVEDLFIDVGMTKDQAQRCICIGDPVYFHMPARRLSSHVLSGPAMDDRACFTCILYALELLQEQGRTPECDLLVIGASCEEMRGKGVFGLGSDLRPDLAVAVDVCHAATYDVEPLDGVHPVGSGPSIAVGAMGRTDFAEKLMDVCDRKEIPYSIDPNIGESWTDADCYFEAGTGIPTMLVSLPLRYMHTPVEQLELEDAENTGRAIAELIGSFGDWMKEQEGGEQW